MGKGILKVGSYLGGVVGKTVWWVKDTSILKFIQKKSLSLLIFY